ncbi:MAG: lysophospholipid acyltransferase family protein [Candidatus Omnitrophica bacterium]|nr:lysophospholipid acyltransferase family protein [Candidatus Omnitrophota bacterium]
MELKKIRKSTGRFFGWLALVVCSWMIKIIPQRSLYGFAETIAHLAYKFTPRQRRAALESLQTAFGNEKGQKEIEDTARQSFVNMAKSAIEIIYLMDKPALLKKRIFLRNKEYLENALKQKRGIILVSAHFGNFPLLLARLSQEGYPVSGIMRPMRDLRVEKIFLAKRRKYGVKTIYSQPRNTCVNSTIEALRLNGIVFIPIDQNFGTAGVFVDFFGRKAATATGPVVFAQRTRAALVPCFIIRRRDNSHEIIFEPPLALDKSDTPQETIRINLQKLTGIIESYIRKYPAEWEWIHRRWKTKPSE